MVNRVKTVGRYTVLEAVRTRLPIVTAVTIALFFAASLFVREIAITDSGRFQTAFYAASVRFAMVFIAALHAISSVTREFQEKGLDMALALDLPRSHYVLGKLAGFLIVAVCLAIAAGVPLIPLAGATAALQWSLSLALELAVVMALSLFCVVTFSSIMPAASFVVAFYLLARSLTAVRLISASPIAGAEAPSHQMAHTLVEGLAFVVPALDQWTRTEWLVNSATAWSQLPSIAFEAVLFATIVTAAAAFDLQRRNF